MRARRRRWAPWLLAAALLGLGAGGVLAHRYGPALSLALVLAAPALEQWLGGGAERVSRQPITVEGAGGQVRADLYRPPAPRGGLLLVHGLSPAGRLHPEMVRVATLLAERGQLVLVPHLEGLASFRLTGREVEEVRAGLRALRRLAPSAGVVGFSFGAGPALIAAADEPDLRVTACFGGYADLRRVIAFVTTGVYELGGERHAVRQEEYNRWKLLALLGSLAEDPADREGIEALARARLANPQADTRGLEAALAPSARAVLALAENRRAEAVGSLLAALPPATGAALDRLSPASAVARIRSRLLIAHGADDLSIPFTESLRLAALAGGNARVVILGGFRHTGPEPEPRWPGRRLVDGARLLPLLDELLGGRPDHPPAAQ